MLAWIGAMLFSAHPPKPQRRHMRRRYGLFSLDAMARMTARLILIRACALAGGSRGPQRRPHNYAPAGFTRRTRLKHFLRSAVGSKLRRALHCRDLRTRLAHLTHALANIDAYAAKHLVPRLERRFTRLFPIIPVRPPHARARIIAPALSPAIANSS
jgi:hypothetical protein